MSKYPDSYGKKTRRTSRHLGLSTSTMRATSSFRETIWRKLLARCAMAKGSPDPLDIVYLISRMGRRVVGSGQPSNPLMAQVMSALQQRSAAGTGAPVRPVSRSGRWMTMLDRLTPSR